jgi:hypothetical protein
MMVVLAKIGAVFFTIALTGSAKLSVKWPDLRVVTSCRCVIYQCIANTSRLMKLPRKKRDSAVYSEGCEMNKRNSVSTYADAALAVVWRQIITWQRPAQSSLVTPSAASAAGQRRWLEGHLRLCHRLTFR